MVAGVNAGAARTPSTLTASPISAASRATTVGQGERPLAADGRRVSQLADSVIGAGQPATEFGASIPVLQGHLSARRRELRRVRDELDAAQSRLGGLEAANAAAARVLANELVGDYEDGSPDIISAVLESGGIADLLDRLAFIERVTRRHARVVAHVRLARRALATEATTVGRLALRARDVARSVVAQRNAIARYRLRLVTERLAAANAQATPSGQLASAQPEVAGSTQQLAERPTAQPAAEPGAQSGARSGAAASTTSATHAGTTTPVTGVPFPLPAGSVAPPATWSLGNGVSIAAPAGTPELAVCNGTIVLHGIGGLGSSAPVLRCDQPLAGYSYVYYGYAGPTHLAAIGANLVRGEPLARVGDGTIDTSGGPHLEIGFADSSGTPLGPATAHPMLTVLRAAYAT